MNDTIQILDNKLIIGTVWHIYNYNDFEVEQAFKKKRIEYIKITIEDGIDYIIKARYTDINACFYFRAPKNVFDNNLTYKI